MPAVRALPALPWRSGTGGVLRFSKPISLQLLKAGELTGQIAYNGIISDAFVTVMENSSGVEEIYFGTANIPRLFKIDTFEGSVDEIKLTYQDHEGGILESVERITVPEIQFTPALPWNEGEGGKIILRTNTTYQDLVDGLLVIVVEVGGEEKDGIITYNENDGKYYLGYEGHLQCYELVNTDKCNVTFTAISNDTKILSIRREFPQILSALPSLPWDAGITGTLNLTDEVEQQFILDRLKVITWREQTGVETKRKFQLNEGRIECLLGNNSWICWLDSFVARKSQFNIRTQNTAYTTIRVKGFIIE